MPRINAKVRVFDGSTIHIHKLKSDGRVGSQINTISYLPGGWTHAKPFAVGGILFLLMLKEKTGHVCIYPLLGDGGLGVEAHHYNWSSGWTSVVPYQVGGTTYIMLLKESNGVVHIHRPEADGKPGSKLHDYDWSSGWTSVVPYEVGGTTYIMLLKESNGIVHIHRPEADGKLGPSLHKCNWSSGWTSVVPYQVGGTTYIMLLKESNGIVHIHRPGADGKLGPSLHKANWGSGWTSVVPYQVGGTTYIMLLKESNGITHIRRPEADGKLGPSLHKYNWSSGWIGASSYTIGTETSLFLLKRTTARPLRRAYVEHIAFGLPVAVYITDNEGRIRDENGNQGIAPLAIETEVDIRILCQNSVVKVIDGSRVPCPYPVWQDFRIKDGDIVNINTNEEQVEHYRILNHCVTVYDNVFKQFKPFRGSSNPEFPLGKQAKLEDTKDQNKRIELSYPDQLPQDLAFVDPIAASLPHIPGFQRGWPVIHIKDRSRDSRLFGTYSDYPTLIPAELSHALHFSLLTQQKRNQIAREYPHWIVCDYLAGQGGTHNLTKETEALVAFIEAVDHFSCRFAEFVATVRNGEWQSTCLEERLNSILDQLHSSGSIPTAAIVTATPSGSGINTQFDYQGNGFGQGVRVDMVFPFVESDASARVLRNTFIVYELSPLAVYGQPAGIVDASGNIVPHSQCQGTNVEGAIYGAIYLDFARRVGLRKAVDAVFESKVLTFGEYRTWIDRQLPSLHQELDHVVQTWRL